MAATRFSFQPAPVDESRRALVARREGEVERCLDSSLAVLVCVALARFSCRCPARGLVAAYSRRVVTRFEA